MDILTRQKVRFGTFQLDSQTGELFKLGQRINLHGQPIEVLARLLAHPGELVTREELRQHLWPQDTFVDFEHSLNTAIKKLRQVLDDDADTPRYIETLPRRGYRFIARVETLPTPISPLVAAENVPQPAGRTAVGGESSPVAALEKAAPESSVEAAVAQPRPPKRSRRKFIAVGAFLFAITAAAALYWFYRPRTPVVTGIHQLTRTGRPKSLWMFHQPVTDGTRVYFEEFSGYRWHVAQVSTQGGEVSYIETPLIQSPFILDILHDGSQLLVADFNGASVDDSIWVVPVPYGPARRIPGMFSGMMFLPRSDRIVYTHHADKSLLTSKLDGSEARPLMSFPGPIGFVVQGVTGPSFAVSPDGKTTRFTAADGKIWESRIDGTGLHRLLPEHEEPMCCGRWSPDGRLYVFASRDKDGYSLWAVSEAVFPLYRSVSQPTRLTSGPIPFQFSVISTDGKQVFALGEALRGELSVYDAKSGKFSSYFNGISTGFLDFSHDGQWVTFVSHPQGTLWRSRVDGSERLQLTFPPMGPIINPKWSPDGRFIAFTEWGDSRKVYLISPGGGSPMLLLSGDFQPADPTWSPDGKSIAYGGAAGVSATPRDVRTEIRILNLETKQSQTIPGSQAMFSPRWSPDGRYIAAQSDDQLKLFLYSFESARWRQMPSDGVGWPAWSHDSRYLYAGDYNSKIHKLRILDGHAEIAGDIAGIDTLCPALPWVGWFGLSSDDRILVLRDRGSDELYALDLEYR